MVGILWCSRITTLLRSFGSKQMRSDPFAFSTITILLTQGAGPSTLAIMPLASIEFHSAWTASSIDRGTPRETWITGSTVRSTLRQRFPFRHPMPWTPQGTRLRCCWHQYQHSTLVTKSRSLTARRPIIGGEEQSTAPKASCWVMLLQYRVRWALHTVAIGFRPQPRSLALVVWIEQLSGSATDFGNYKDLSTSIQHKAHLKLVWTYWDTLLPWASQCVTADMTNKERVNLSQCLGSHKLIHTLLVTTNGKVIQLLVTGLTVSWTPTPSMTSTTKPTLRYHILSRSWYQWPLFFGSA